MKVFPDNSVGKESTCYTGDPSLIPGSGRSVGEGNGYPLQYFWASFVAQLVKNLQAMSQTWVWSLSWEDHLEKGKAIHSSIVAWRIPWTVQSIGSQRVQTPKNDVLFVIGDWNGKVGSQQTPGVTGKFGLGVRNEAGQRLIEFCQEKALVIANTLFKQHKRRLYTWT